MPRQDAFRTFTTKRAFVAANECIRIGRQISIATFAIRPDFKHENTISSLARTFGPLEQKVCIFVYLVIDRKSHRCNAYCA
jgi:hypothetical protein